MILPGGVGQASSGGCGVRMMLAGVCRLRPSRAVVRAIRVVVGLLVIGVLVVEGVTLAGHSGTLADALGRANLGLVALALTLEAASWLAFAALHRRMLSSGGLRVPLPKIASALLVANALSATLPVGSAVAAGYNFTRFRRFGASGPLAAWVLVISGLISTATLGALGLAAASVVGSNRTSSVAAIIAVAITVAVAAALHAANQRPEALVRLGRRGVRAWNRISRHAPSHGFDRVDAFVAQVVLIRPRGRDWLAGVGFAAVNWITDVACFVVACHAVGISDLAPRVIVIAYAADAVVGAAPLLPGGIGLVEGALVIALVGGGIPFAAATAAVVIYRGISFVLVAVVGWALWLATRDRQHRARDAIDNEGNQGARPRIGQILPTGRPLERQDSAGAAFTVECSGTSGRHAPAMTAASASSAAATVSECNTPKWLPRNPISGGPAKKAV